jgi:hypothetical protein
MKYWIIINIGWFEYVHIRGIENNRVIKKMG